MYSSTNQRIQSSVFFIPEFHEQLIYVMTKKANKNHIIKESLTAGNDKCREFYRIPKNH